MWFVCLLLAVIALLLWMLYTTVDGFNEDLKQLRVLVGHIERFIAENSEESAVNQKKVSLLHAGEKKKSDFAGVEEQANKILQNSTIAVNSANKTALMSLPKVGAATAQKIIENRPYASWDELKEKVGLSDETFELLKDRVSI